MTTTRPTRRRLGRLAVLLASFLTVAMPLRTEAQLTCGGTIGPGGTFTMTSDLTACPGTALTVVGPVVLDMNQRTVSCSGLSTGLRIEGKGATVRNGKVSGCTIGVDLEGNGGHKVREVRADGNAIGFGVSTDGNLLAYNVSDTPGGGFQVNGNRNKLVGNLSVNSDNDAFQVSGNGNVFVQNAARAVDFGWFSFLATRGSVSPSPARNTC